VSKKNILQLEEEVKRKLRLELKRINKNNISQHLDTEIIEKILFFRKFLQDRTQHKSFSKSLNSKDKNIYFELLRLVFIHAEKIETPYYIVIHSMVILESIVDYNMTNLTELDLLVIKNITDNRIIEVFREIWNENVTYTNNFQQKILNDSYNYIDKHVVVKLKKIQKDLDSTLVLNDILDIQDVIYLHNSKLNDLYTNSYKISNLKANNHSFSFIRNMSLDINESKFILKEFCEILINGYINMHLLNSFGNRVDRKYIQNNNIHIQAISSLEFYDFMLQNKSHAKFIPFVSIQQRFRLSNIEIENYTRFILGNKPKNFHEILQNIRFMNNL